MRLETNEIEIINPNWSEVKIQLDRLDRREIEFLIIELENQNYLQSAGRSDKMTVEYREYSGEKFKHYVLGRGEKISPLKVDWHLLATGLGSIMIHREEVLSRIDAEIIVNMFYCNHSIPSEFSKRNVTKLYS